MSERIAYQFNGDHVLKFAGMQKLTGEHVADELNRLYNTIAALEREVERLNQQHFTDLCNSADVKRLISVVAFPDNYADQDFSEMAKRVLAKMEHNIKALSGGEAV